MSDCEVYLRCCELKAVLFKKVPSQNNARLQSNAGNKWLPASGIHNNRITT